MSGFWRQLCCAILKSLKQQLWACYFSVVISALWSFEVLSAYCAHILLVNMTARLLAHMCSKTWTKDSKNETRNIPWHFLEISMFWQSFIIKCVFVWNSFLLFWNKLTAVHIDTAAFLSVDVIYSCTIGLQSMSVWQFGGPMHWLLLVI